MAAGREVLQYTYIYIYVPQKRKGIYVEVLLTRELVGSLLKSEEAPTAEPASKSYSRCLEPTRDIITPASYRTTADQGSGQLPNAEINSCAEGDLSRVEVEILELAVSSIVDACIAGRVSCGYL